MDFRISDDRRMLAESLGRFLAETCPIEARADIAYTPPFHDPKALDGLTDLGVFYALVGEDHGGMGGAGFDIAVVFEELGRGLCPEPVLPALLAARLLAASGADLDPLLTGAARYAAGIGELDAPYDLDGITTRAEADGATWRVSGRKSVVYGGHIAERLLIAAQCDAGLALFSGAATDAEVISYGMIDGGGAAEVILDHTPAELVLKDARAALQNAVDAGALALCAEALGVMETANAALVDYLKTRKQFGRPIGAFQALQHRAVDLAIEIEQARSIVIRAADGLDGPNGSHKVSQAKFLVGKIARQVAEEVIQMHGGIAMTWEYPVSHLAKRLVMIDHQLGDVDFHLDRLMGALQAEA